MKKLYISCPVVERNYNDVVKSFTMMHKVAEAYFGEELKVINSAEELKVENIDAQELLKHLETISEADYFIGICDCYFTLWDHLDLEYNFAKKCGIPIYVMRIGDVAPDHSKITYSKAVDTVLY